MTSSSDVTTFDSTKPWPRAASTIMEGLQNEIPPERIVSRIKDMLEATCIAPSGTECTDWRTVEAGVMLYLTCTRPVTPENRSVPEPQTMSQALNGLTQPAALTDPALTGTAGKNSTKPAAPQQPVAKTVARRHPESLELMRKMMVVDPNVLASGGGSLIGGTLRRPRDTAASNSARLAGGERAVRPPLKRSAFTLVTARQFRWLAMLLVCFTAAWVAGGSLRKSATAQQAGPPITRPRPAFPAAVPRPTQNEEMTSWFLEDHEAEYSPRVAHGDFLE